MSYYSPWPVLVITLAVWAAAALPPFRAADGPPVPTRPRIATLDGLRGFLALAVFFHHGAIYHRYLMSGHWELPPSRLYTLLGPVGVAMFFMITGYLFWSQMLKASGRPEWLKLYIGRLFRILPLYWFAFALVLAGVVLHTGLHLRAPPGDLAKSLAKWTLGGYFPEVSINGYDRTWALLAGVTWTLHYEWLFYASLFVTGRFALDRRLGVAMPCLALLGALAVVFMTVKPAGGAGGKVCVTLFLMGMTVAALEFAPRVWSRLQAVSPQAWIATRAGNLIASLAVAGLLIAAFTLFSVANTIGPLVMLGLAFLLVANGANLFGLLTSRPAKRLGDVSYGIYLLQGPVLAAGFLAPAVRRLALASPVAHWGVVAVDAFVLVSLATATHVLIERPGVDLGRRAWRRIARRPARLQDAAA